MIAERLFIDTIEDNEVVHRLEENLKKICRMPSTR